MRDRQFKSDRRHQGFFKFNHFRRPCILFLVQKALSLLQVGSSIILDSPVVANRAELEKRFESATNGTVPP
jgi:hypothetical protein